jgi:hypothetical protein
MVGGGGISSGGGYTLQGNVRASAPTASGGGFHLQGGLFGVYVIQDDVDAEILLHVERLEDGQARITWPATATGYRLEVTTSLEPRAPWQPVLPAPGGNAFVTPWNQPARFYRLAKP